MASQGDLYRQKLEDIDNQTLNKVLMYNPYHVHDGEQCLYKTARLTASGAIIGAYISVFDLAVYKGTPLTYMLALGKFVKWTFPVASMGAAYGATICIASHLRGNKSDELNHAFGGAMIGAVIGAKSQNMQMGCWTAVGFGILCSIIKHGTKYDWWKLTTESLGAPKERPLWFYKTAFLTTRPQPMDTGNEATN
ncbi:hypothetical protein CHS0354_037317 [Potamilus streckersoni]|uniref:NADH dehydrogenase [ubiquinone] 1 alpha subcomplex subunit 11 n=1 Tax=Potamilus streckersoni TaxID=2493646 RepID=A0AAE0TJW0_9BIVA|nr:hypothetical protein CHS0354_037317 [Potamilus streckersoni]